MKRKGRTIRNVVTKLTTRKVSNGNFLSTLLLNTYFYHEQTEYVNCELSVNYELKYVLYNGIFI